MSSSFFFVSFPQEEEPVIVFHLQILVPSLLNLSSVPSKAPTTDHITSNSQKVLVSAAHTTIPHNWSLDPTQLLCFAIDGPRTELVLLSDNSLARHY